MLTVFGLMAVAAAILLIVQVVRLAWRLFGRNEEPVAGGSWGKQLFDRPKERKRNIP